ncbi:InlB B-repeat-containing protein (plasmid) [Enterococcus faecalis]|uniref:InlB B-repeat-containing protein n=1 Tax=Enterococcus faecalis TaxID=1351 RepID=UPI0019DF2E32|nr:hypothetical protein [Enterococcus faecalis]EGO8815079.1 hypothetical protein [Enterococcus faecalis]EIF1589219.1 InlB B-repeat-containing protein [Enterococcus faecalis]EKZ0447926.1 InlB B-repeat-containing protein [Enterococcus faecalis]ELT8937087.1 InlB B-repeat-containing protein [Enterococcus faecalis]
MKKSIVLSTIVLFSSQILLPTVAIAETNQQNTTDSNNQNQVMIPTDSSQVEDENTVSSEKDNNISEESSKHNSVVTPSENNKTDHSISLEENTSISNDTTDKIVKNEDEDSKVDNSFSNNEELKSTQGISLGKIQVVDQYQTYIDPITGVKPGELTVSVPVTVSEEGISDAYIVIPYGGCIPSIDNPVFSNFSMNSSIFEYVQNTDIPSNSIVSSYENDVVNKRIIVRLKETVTSVETINLKFKFNDEYMGKIPVNQIIWSNLYAEIYILNNKIDQTDSVNITSSTRDGMGLAYNYMNPSDQYYSDGRISTRLRYVNNFNQYSKLDVSKDNQMYIELPTGSIINNQATKNYFDFSSGQTNIEDNSIPVGYTRYYRKLTDDSSSFTNWHSGGNPNKNSILYDFQFTPPSTIKTGEYFYVNFGMKYFKYNSEKKVISSQVKYQKIDTPEWQISGTGGDHSTGTSTNATVVINEPNSVSNENIAFGWKTYEHVWTTKNTGKKPIKGMKFEILQQSDSSALANFNSITIYGTKANKDVADTYYKTVFEIKNTEGNTREVTSNLYKGTHNVPIPDLISGEYINKITVIPMGETGTSEGVFLPSNGFAIGYTCKNWISGKWPNGSTIEREKVYEIDFAAKMYYEDESNPQNVIAIEKAQPMGKVFYTAAATQAKAQIVSSNSFGKSPGDTVNYTIQGYNGNSATGVLKNPKIAIAIPKVLELKNPNELKTFEDKVNNKIYKENVVVKLINTDEKYNYYSIESSVTVDKNGEKVAFEIPLEFTVKNGAMEGNYKIPAVAITGKDFLQIDSYTNNLSSELAELLGLSNDVPHSYTATVEKNTSLTIVRSSRLFGRTFVRENNSANWSNTSILSVNQEEKPQMKVAVSNEGNTTFNKAKIYNVLPYDGDKRGSTGNIEFKEILQSNTSAKVYYTNKPVDELPEYGTDINAWTSEKLESLGFTLEKPKNLSTVTAIFIDFEESQILPNSIFESILEFFVPKAENQKAVNQFQYSAQEVGTGTLLNGVSEKVIFSTEIASVYYDSNLPSVLVPGISDATNIPETQNILLKPDGSGEITIPSIIPILPGYNFVSWEDEEGNRYSPNDKIQFTKNSSKKKINLKAIWQAKKVNVIYNDNFGNTPREVTKEYRFGDTVQLSDVTIPIREGYTFKGWSESNVATVPDFLENSKIDFVDTKVVYAVWEANDYTIKFDANGGKGTMPDQVMKYDQAENLTQNAYIKEGYIFKGWSTEPNGNVKYKDKEVVKNLVSNANGEIRLYAVWLEGLQLSVPDSIGFGSKKLSKEDKIYGVEEVLGKELTVTDNRGSNNTWKLGVKLLQPLTNVDNGKQLLNSLVYKNKTGEQLLTDSDTQIVETENTTEDNFTWNISKTWTENSGLLLKVDSGKASLGEYTTTIEWTLNDTP